MKRETTVWKETQPGSQGVRTVTFGTPGDPRGGRTRLGEAGRWRWTVWGVALCLAALLVAPLETSARVVGGKRGVTTYQQNLYVGGNIDRLLELDPQDPAYPVKLLQAVTTTYYEILASQFPLRAQGLAAQIARDQPELVALQEVSLVRRQYPSDFITGQDTPATEVVLDFLDILLDALEARGLHYAAVSAVQDMDVEMPALDLEQGGFQDVRLTDRDVILARVDLPPGQFRVTNPQGSNFVHALTLPSLGLAIERGWCSVDVFISGRRFRYINTHLEEETVPQIQAQQAQELLDGPANVALPVLLTGDFNSDGNRQNGTVTYDHLLAAGFADPWTVLHPGDPGLTWGHDPNLADPTVAFVWRIDLVLVRGGDFLPQAMDVRDVSISSSTPPRWVSDHAGVVTRFRLP